MIYKVLIMQVNNKYSIGLSDDGTFLRIKNKDGVCVGDKIYVLEEDIIQQPTVMHTILHSPYLKKTIITCALLIICIAAWYLKPVQTYAMVSVDGKQSVQLAVDKNGKILNAYSRDGSYSKEEIKQFQGRELKNVAWDNSKKIIGVSLDEDSEDFIEDLKKIFGKDAIYMIGTDSDYHASKKQKLSLGIYLLHQNNSKEDVKDILEEYDVDDIHELIKKHPEFEESEEQDEDSTTKVEDVEANASEDSEEAKKLETSEEGEEKKSEEETSTEEDSSEEEKSSEEIE